MTETLNDCPFCGGRAFVVPCNEKDADYIECSESTCHASIFGRREHGNIQPALIGRWNQRVSAWQPGDTAPKDGTKFIAWTGLADFEICEWVETKRHSYEETENGLFKRIEIVDGYWNNNTPVSWHPIPKIEGGE